jgi:opacity protein-like surface antigen
MRKSVLVLAVIGAACSSVAFAAEVKKEKAHVPAVKATTMSDAQMDKVTAGDAGLNGIGHAYAFGRTEHPANTINNGLGPNNVK